MFTGIITDRGEIVALERAPEGGDMRVRIACNYDPASIDIGASIACDGVCLTVVARGDSPRAWFEVQASGETQDKTNLSDWAEGHVINLERALKVGDELGGHIVSGHVDGMAEIVGMRDEAESTRFTFRAPASLGRFIAPKGSVALDGTSLTVNEVVDVPGGGCDFGVNIIPHTKVVTGWGVAQIGQKVNLEIDTLARYVARLAEAEQ
ncbi:riboflavin synthase [Phaeovulum vinaykumarii]|uniref:Riboflavin synthase n=1 Tax=Phaeovulum vinaykumarii TaxID=407234 RepID=A0A1N7LVM8_9RHOB|nr:riboflavin synthase [Phaeovulum vinaykumarii]SIS77877.1 riboflavin synthase alpha chain [Phaeovulum vinaykumarii]SOC07263.1 riboflavin synthase alpha chain [Phaeovulum vinaykumarii]